MSDSIEPIRESVTKITPAHTTNGLEAGAELSVMQSSPIPWEVRSVPLGGEGEGRGVVFHLAFGQLERDKDRAKASCAVGLFRS